MVRPKERTSKSELLIYERQAGLCKALGHPVRIRILDLVGKTERPCSELQSILGVSKANLSQHVSQLRQAGMIVTRRHGKQLFCSIAMPEVKRACETIRNVLRLQMKHHHKLFR